MNKYNIFREIAEKETPHLFKWYLETPVVINSEKYTELHTVQQLLHKAICYFVKHYEEYSHIFTLSDSTKRIVDICKPYPYKTGTYRPDFLIDTDGRLKICEIGSRFPLNGYFLSGIAEYIGETRLSCTPELNRKRESEKFLDYLMKYWGSFSKLCVLKGNDRPCDIKYYIPYFEKLGIETIVISPNEIEKNWDELTADAAVVSEFNQMEMEKLSTRVLEAIAASNALNDMRSIFLIHDKRFLAVLSHKTFLQNAMTEEEAEFLKGFLIPTYTRNQHPKIWEAAKLTKNQWLIKHFLLGKSEKVYAGCMVSNEEWTQLFNSSEMDNMVLQPYISQKRIQSKIGNQTYHDFVVGTLLCFDDHFFGTGIFRASSFEIINRGDDRKMAPWITDNYTTRKDIFIL